MSISLSLDSLFLCKQIVCTEMVIMVVIMLSHNEIIEKVKVFNFVRQLRNNV